MARSSNILMIWTCAGFIFPIIANENITLSVEFIETNWTLFFHEETFVQFHECLCNPFNARCSLKAKHAGGNARHIRVQNLKVENQTTRTPGFYTCSLGTWFIECNTSKSARTCSPESTQCFTLENKGNTCQSPCVDLMWNSSQTISLTTQSKFNAIMTQGQCSSRYPATTPERPVDNGNSQVRNHDKSNSTLLYIVGGTGAGVFVIGVTVIALVLWWRRKRIGHAGNHHGHYIHNDAGDFQDNNHYSEPQDCNVTLPKTSYDNDGTREAEYQNINQVNGLLSQDDSLTETEPCQRSRGQSHQSSTVKLTNPPPSSSSETKTYAKLREVQREMVNIYNDLPPED